MSFFLQTRSRAGELRGGGGGPGAEEEFCATVDTSGGPNKTQERVSRAKQIRATESHKRSAAFL